MATPRNLEGLRPVLYADLSIRPSVCRDPSSSFGLPSVDKQAGKKTCLTPRDRMLVFNPLTTNRWFSLESKS